VPGFRTVVQVEDPAGAMTCGSLNPEQMTAIREMRDRS